MTKAQQAELDAAREAVVEAAKAWEARASYNDEERCGGQGLGAVIRRLNDLESTAIEAGEKL